jgi:hypothetical protein
VNKETPLRKCYEAFKPAYPDYGGSAHEFSEGVFNLKLAKSEAKHTGQNHMVIEVEKRDGFVQQAVIVLEGITHQPPKPLPAQLGFWRP